MTNDQEKALEQYAQELDAIVDNAGVQALSTQAPLVQAVKRAEGMRLARDVLTEKVVKRHFMPLMGSQLGFVTDRDREPADKRYGWETVREVMVEALLRGFRPTENEFNIIAGRFYGAKAGFDRIVREFPGLSELRFQLGVPERGPDSTALVPFDASWKYHGEDEVLTGRKPANETDFDTRIPVRINAGMGPDAILGKAQRKLMARIYQRLTGCASSIADEADTIITTGSVAAVESIPEGRRMPLGRARTREPGEEG